MNTMRKKPRRTSMMATAAILALACAALPSRAQSILDQQLGQKPDDAKPQSDAAKPQDANAPKPATADTPKPTPVAPDMISPGASKAVDDLDLVNKLTGADANKDADADKIKEMIDRMGQSQERLVSKDAGPITQETQKRIVNDLDVMIELARKQQQNSQGKQNQDSKQQPGQKRQMTTGQQQGPHQEGGNQAATDSSLPRGPVSTPQSNGEDMHQKGPQEWGNLPPRERDLISNGASEQYLPSYKEMIDRYYQALAEIGKSKER